MQIFLMSRLFSLRSRGAGRSIIGGPIFIYSCSQTVKTIYFKIYVTILKEINFAEHEYMNIAPPPIIDLPAPLLKSIMQQSSIFISYVFFSFSLADSYKVKAEHLILTFWISSEKIFSCVPIHLHGVQRILNSDLSTVK